jgi:hypothetical protein
MKFIRWAVVATLAVAFQLQAQTPASAPPSPAPVHGPTMEQTIAFINDAMAGKDLFHSTPISVIYQDGCSVLMRAHLVQAAPPNDTEVVHIKLDQSDPLTVSAAQYGGGGFFVTVGHLFAEVVWPAVPSSAIPIDLTGVQTEVSLGRIQSVVGSNVVVLSDSGQLFRFQLLPKATIRLDKPLTLTYEVGAASNLLPGAFIDLWQYEGYDPKKPTKRQGIEQLIKISLLDEGTIPFHYLPFIRQIPKYPDVTLFASMDQKTAESVAKAWIHAMVLCYKPAKPSLF